MPQKIKSKSSGELSKHSCVNVITVLCGPAQVTHSDSWLPDSFSFRTKKMGPFSIRKHRARSLKLWNNLALCSQQWMKMQTLHKYCSNKKQHKKFKEGQGKWPRRKREEGEGHRALLGKIVMIYYEIQWPMTKTGVEQMKWEKNMFIVVPLPFFVLYFPFPSLGFEGLLLAVPALILQLLQLLQYSSRLVGSVDQHAQQLEAKTEQRKRQINSCLMWTTQDKSEQTQMRIQAKVKEKIQITKNCGESYILTPAQSAREHTVSREIKRLFSQMVVAVYNRKHCWLTAPHIKMKVLLGNGRWLTRHRCLGLRLLPPPSVNFCWPTSLFESVQPFD